MGTSLADSMSLNILEEVVREPRAPKMIPIDGAQLQSNKQMTRKVTRKL